MKTFLFIIKNKAFRSMLLGVSERLACFFLLAFCLYAADFEADATRRLLYSIEAIQIVTLMHLRTATLQERMKLLEKETLRVSNEAKRAEAQLLYEKSLRDIEKR